MGKRTFCKVWEVIVMRLRIDGRMTSTIKSKPATSIQTWDQQTVRRDMGTEAYEGVMG